MLGWEPRHPHISTSLVRAWPWCLPTSSGKGWRDSSVVSCLVLGVCCRSGRHPCSWQVVSGVLAGCSGFMGSGACDSMQHLWQCSQFSQTCSCCMCWHSWAHFHLVILGTDSNDCTVAWVRLAISLGRSIPSWARWDWYKDRDGNVAALKLWPELLSGQETSKHEAATSSKPTCHKYLFNI